MADVVEGSSSRALHAFLTLAGALAAGCRATPPPVPFAPPHGLAAAVEYHAGVALSGGGAHGDASAISEDPAAALALGCELFYLERRPASTLTPLARHTVLIASFDDPRPLRASSAFAQRSYAGGGSEAERLRAELREGLLGPRVELAELGAVLPRGATATFALRSGEGAELRELSLHAGRDADGVTLCLELQGRAPAGASEVSEREPAPLDRRQRELLLFSAQPALDGTPFALLVPSPFEDEARALALFLTLAPAPSVAKDPEAAAVHAAAVARCLDELRASGADAVLRAGHASREDARRRALSSVLARLEGSADPRGALVSLASAHRARVALDLALAADDAVLARFAAAVERAHALHAVGEGRDDPAVAWLLDRTALRVLARAGLEADEVPELLALLLLHTGQLGRYASALLELLEGSADRDAFARGCSEENRAFLRDPDPGARVRAFDWLSARGAAPAGYDPLANAE